MAEQHSLDFEPRPEDSRARATRDADEPARLEEAKRKVDQALSSAEQLGRNDPATGPAFAHVERLAIACPDMEVHIRVFERSARFHERSGAVTRALQKCRIALRNAESLSVKCDTAVEDMDRLRYECLRLENHRSAKFANLIEAAQVKKDAYRARCKAWWSYCDDANHASDRLAARGLGSKEDFRRRLDAAELDLSDDEDE